jgi:Domain of unknown function (DUF4386)
MSVAEYAIQKKTARQAGLVYFIFALVAIYGSMYVPSQIIVAGDTPASVKGILANEFLFRSGIASNLIGLTLFVLLVLVLYQLLKPVNELLAKLMAALVMVGVPIDFMGNISKMRALKILNGDVLQSFEIENIYDLAMVSYRNYGGQMVTLYWGLWLIPLGLLVYKSGFIPRIFGVLLIVNGTAYILNMLTFILFPDYLSLVSKLLTVFFFVGEIPFIFWLLLKGVKDINRTLST